MRPRSSAPGLIAPLVLASIVCAVPRANAQAQGAAAPVRTARQSAPIDITGYWVAFVTEDWRFRMTTPPKGDYTRVPLTPEGRKVADAWDPAADEAAGNQCKAFGAAAIMRVPGRVHITWQDDNTLHIDSDAGMQARALNFAASAPPAERTWQGHSTARWDGASQSLIVTTGNMRAGYLRWNGVPYSENAAMTEYFDLSPLPDGGRLLVVTTTVEDSRFLQRSFVVSSHFKQERDGSKWNPTPCTARW
jgi:hypothetical protein